LTAVRQLRQEGSKEFDFSTADFNRVRAMIYAQAGIALAQSKHEMVYSRLARRLRAVGMTSFTAYLDALDASPQDVEWEAFTNALTTNLTSFFREEHHFPILADHARRAGTRTGTGAREPFRVWCAASSSGEEPYSIAMTLCEVFDTLTPPVQVIATDIDTNVLATAASGVYPEERIEKLSGERARRFLLRGKGANAGLLRVRPELRNLVSFSQLNLLESRWPVSGPFDAIFCRNVMIYFDKPTQGKVLSRFAPLMKPDGLLFAGHSENFAYVTDAFKLRAKTVYQLSRQAMPGAVASVRPGSAQVAR
jgi:chemotaxis protein methyltransferase CheR